MWPWTFTHTRADIERVGRPGLILDAEWPGLAESVSDTGPGAVCRPGPIHAFGGTHLNIPEALKLYDTLGLCVIPLKHRDKRPALSSWAAYQERRSTPEEWGLWWPSRGIPHDDHKGNIERRHSNIGVVTGAISNILVLDLDDEDTFLQVTEAMPWLLETMIVRTGRGFHLYLRPTTPAGKTTTFRLNDKLHHVKSDGGYVVAPPSVHPSGSVYTFDADGVVPIEVDPAVLTKGLRLLGAEANTPEVTREDRTADWVTSALVTDAPEGQRNKVATELAGWFRNVIVYRRDVTLELLRLWNEAHCKPPLPLNELELLVNHKYDRYPPPAAPLG